MNEISVAEQGGQYNIKSKYIETRTGPDGNQWRCEFRRCGKETCRCQVEGNPGHGPYWFVISDGVKTYKGANPPDLPPRVDAIDQLLQRYDLLDLPQGHVERAERLLRALQQASFVAREVVENDIEYWSSQGHRRGRRMTPSQGRKLVEGLQAKLTS